MILKYPNDFWHKRKMYNFDPYNVLLTIATNIPVLLMTAFVLQGHKCDVCGHYEFPMLETVLPNIFVEMVILFQDSLMNRKQ